MKRVLVVDDDPTNRYYLEQLLGSRGLEVRAAANGNEALASTATTVPDLVVSDLLMPGMDGFTLLRRWKADPTLRSARFVVYTATYTDEQDEKLALSLGADAFLVKPLEPAELCARLDEVLSRPAAATPAGAEADESESVVLGQYNQALVRKLEDKMRELDRTIAERSRVERELLESERRLRQLAEAVHEVFWMSTADRTTIQYLSPSYERIWGRPVETAMADPRSWFEAIHPDDRDAALQTALSHEGDGHYEQAYRVRRPDGQVRWVRERVFPVTDAAGVVTGVAGVAGDETESRETEASRRLLEEQLQRAQKMDAIGTLAGGIAHDFNNILTAILGNAELAAMDPSLSEGTRRSIDEIARAGQRARRLVQQILTFSRRNSTQLAVIDPRPVVEDAVQLLRSTLPAGIQLGLTIEGPVPNVLADPVQIHQILLNLGTNAWHAIQSESGHIEVLLDAGTVEAKEGPRRCARLSVRDDGAGMDEEIQARIFEPFFTTKAAGQGTGLGLSVVHGVVEALGGSIAVTSRPGEGTLFTITLPETDGAARPRTSATTKAARGGGEHVLYLDDEEQLVFLAVRMLKQQGYRVSGFSRAEDAMEALRADPSAFDLIVTDYNMPTVSGLQVAREVRDLRPDLPVVMASGYVTEELRGKCEELGVVRLVEKPDTVDALCSIVQEILASGAPDA